MTRLKQLSLLQPRRLAVGLCVACALLLVLFRPTPTQADGVVTDCSSQQGLADAMNAGSGLITFNCGSAPMTILITQSGGLNVVTGNSDTIDGGGLITLSGGDATRIFTVQSGAALTLTNITLSHGSAASGTGLDLQGGAILNDGGVLVLNNVTVRDSQSTFAAGAIENAYGTALLQNSLIENNQSDYGGGIDSVGALTLINTTVRGNHALTDTGGGLDISGTVVIDNSLIADNGANNNNGGGIYSLAALTITNSSLVNNTAGVHSGGGIYNFGVTLTLTDTTLSGNSAIAGGGIYNETSAILSGVTLSGNSASDSGAGIFNDHILVVSNATLSGNSAINNGGGIWNGGLVNLYNATIVSNTADSDNNTTGTGGGVFNGPLKTFNLHNSLVAGNKQGNGTSDCHGPIGSYGRNLLYVLADCTVVDGPNSSHSLISSLASIGPLQNNGGPTLTHMPRLGSEMIDGGDAVAGCLGPGDVLSQFDQRGLPRAIDGDPNDDNDGAICDVGAVERQPTDTGLPPRLWLPLVVR